MSEHQASARHRHHRVAFSSLGNSQLGELPSVRKPNAARYRRAAHRCMDRGWLLPQAMMWMVKTHWPSRPGPKFEVSKVVLIVRSPLDAIASFWHLMLAGSHCSSAPEAMFETFPKVWDGFVASEAEVWRRFHTLWLGGHGGGDSSRTVRVPTLVLRLLRSKSSTSWFLAAVLSESPTTSTTRSALVKDETPATTPAIPTVSKESVLAPAMRCLVQLATALHLACTAPQTVTTFAPPLV